MLGASNSGNVRSDCLGPAGLEEKNTGPQSSTDAQDLPREYGVARRSVLNGGQQHNS